MAPILLSSSNFQELPHLLSNTTACPGKYHWAYTALGECVHDAVGFAGLILGLASIGFWLVAQAPQLYHNFKTGTAKGLSLFFLAEWLAGDITNLIGCILTDQVPTQLYTAIYFCLLDSCMLLQYLYYEKYKNRKKDGTTSLNMAVLVAVACLGSTLLLAQGSLHSNTDDSVSYGRTLKKIHSFDSPTSIAGYVIGWASGLMYFTSRIPQIVMNFKRKSTEGLSVLMFIMAICGNVTYACGVLMQSVEVDFIIDHLPWLVGSVGTLVFDFTIFVQFLCFRNRKSLSETSPLLQPLEVDDRDD